MTESQTYLVSYFFTVGNAMTFGDVEINIIKPTGSTRLNSRDITNIRNHIRRENGAPIVTILNYIRMDPTPE